MQNFAESIANFAGQHWSALVGALVVVAFARERFNEPTFPNRETLPRTVAPLRYLFLGLKYERARHTYVVGSLALYLLLLAPGKDVIAVLGIDPKTFPPQAWALAVALLLVGLLPATKVKWISMLEEWLRRCVHGWFLVPAGITRAIGMIEDAPYNPPRSELEALADGQRDRIEADLKLKRSTLRHRWARATTLMASLGQMGAGSDSPLQAAAFAPFKEDFDAINARYRSLAQDIPPPGKSISLEKENALKDSVDALLRRIYAYIIWGVRQQARSEAGMVETLETLGFSITVLQGRRLFDIVAPAAGAVALITFLFWVVFDALKGREFQGLQCVIAAMAAAIMYGWGAFMALKQRSLQIEERAWRQGSPKSLITISWKSGLIAVAVIVATTFVLRYAETLQSLSAWLLWEPSGPATNFLPTKIVTALPWFLAGATASAVLASLMGGDVRRTDKHQRLRDALWLGVALGIAVVLAQLVQSDLAERLKDIDRTPIEAVPIIGFVGFACGVIIGYMVPYACRANLMTPPDPGMARTLRDLLARAETSLGSRAAASDWVFLPNTALRGITPAEAIQYEGYKNPVRQLLDSETPQEQQGDEDRNERQGPVVVAGRLPGTEAA
jgi:hypothetical protein